MKNRVLKEPSFTPWRLGLIGVFLLAVLAFAPTITGLPFSDDMVFLYGKPRSLWDVLTGPFLGNYWRPLTGASYWLDRELFGPNPLMWHQTSVLIHAVTAVVVAVFGLEITKRPIASVLAGALFAVQPAQMTVIGWIGGRTDALPCLFGLLYALCLVRWVKGAGERQLVFAGVWLMLAMLSKEQAIALAAAAPIAALWTKTSWKRAALASGIPAVIFLGLWLVLNPEKGMAAHPGAGYLTSLVGRSAVNYSSLLLAPNPWSMSAYTPHVYESPAWVILGYLVVAGAIGLIWWLGRRQPLMALLVLCAFLAWVPVSGIVPVRSLLLGPYRIGISGGFVALALGCALRPAVAGVYAAGCLAFTLWSSFIVAGPVEYYSEALRRDPQWAIATTGLCSSLEDRSKFAECLVVAEQGLTRAYGSTDWSDHAKALANLSNNIGYRYDGSELLNALWCVRAEAQAGLKRYDDAIATMTKLKAIFPDSSYPDECIRLYSDLKQRHRLAAITYVPK